MLCTKFSVRYFLLSTILASMAFDVGLLRAEELFTSVVPAFNEYDIQEIGIQLEKKRQLESPFGYGYNFPDEKFNFDASNIFKPTGINTDIIIRGQSPTFVDPNNGAQIPYPNVQAPTVINPYGNQGLGFDPFQAPQGSLVAPNGFAGQIDPYTGQPITPQINGLNGSQPYRFGWSSRWSVANVFDADTSSGGVDTGELSILEVDHIADYVTMGPNGWVWTWSPEVNYRSFTGPDSPNLSPNYYRFASGIKLDSPDVNGWHWQGTFTPAVATDFEQSIDSDALQFDAQMALYYRANQQFMWALGAMYWDRVDDIVLPFGGFVWTPNQYWEFRLLFPRPRVDLFLGAVGNHAWWLYGGGEYRVEAYQTEVSPPGTIDQIQSTEWRAYGGLRGDNGWLSHFVEAGYVFEREYEFKQSTAPFDVDGAFFVRGGFRY